MIDEPTRMHNINNIHHYWSFYKYNRGATKEGEVEVATPAPFVGPLSCAHSQRNARLLF